MPDTVLYDRIAEMDVAIQRGGLDISVMEYRQVGNTGFMSGFDYNKGEHFFAQVEVPPDSMGSKNSEIKDHLKKNGAQIYSSAKEIKHFPDGVPDKMFDEEARKHRAAVQHQAPPETGPKNHETTLHINKESGAVHSAGSFGKKLGDKLGIAGGVAIGAYYALKGDFAAAAESVIPGGTAAAALAQGRPTEAILSGIEEIPLGAIATEFVRPLAGAAGLDVNPGIMQSINGALGQQLPAFQLKEREFDKIYNALPDKVTDGMPPEIASLVEQKQMIVQAESKLDSVNNQPGTASNDLAKNRLEAQQRLDRTQQAYTKQYESMSQNGGLDHVRDYLKNNPQGQPPAATNLPDEKNRLSVAATIQQPAQNSPGL